LLLLRIRSIQLIDDLSVWTRPKPVRCSCCNKSPETYPKRPTTLMPDGKTDAARKGCSQEQTINVAH